MMVMGTTRYCKYCKVEIGVKWGQKPKQYCSDACRSKYWHAQAKSTEYRKGNETVCAACGEIFYAYGVQGRKYCCHEHYIADRFKREIIARPKEPLLIGEIGEEAPEPIFEETSEWDFPYPNESIPMLCVRAAHAEEKLRPKRVYLIAGPSKFQGKYDHFVGLIPMTAQEQLLDGDVFVYCNAQRTQLCVLQWQDDGFALFFKRTEFGHYPWPFTPELKLIEIAPMDLQMLLEIPCLEQRLSGIPTVERRV